MKIFLIAAVSVFFAVAQGKWQPGGQWTPPAKPEVETTFAEALEDHPTLMSILKYIKYAAFQGIELEPWMTQFMIDGLEHGKKWLMFGMEKMANILPDGLSATIQSAHDEMITALGGTPLLYESFTPDPPATALWDGSPVSFRERNWEIFPEVMDSIYTKIESGQPLEPWEIKYLIGFYAMKRMMTKKQFKVAAKLSGTDGTTTAPEDMKTALTDVIKALVALLPEEERWNPPQMGHGHGQNMGGHMGMGKPLEKWSNSDGGWEMDDDDEDDD